MFKKIWIKIVEFIKNVFTNIVNHKISIAEIQKLGDEGFNKIDTNKDGYISLAEIYKALKK